MSTRHPLIQFGGRGLVATLTALILAAVTPAYAGAASSGGWNNLGHGPTVTSAALNATVETLLPVGATMYVGGDFTNAGGVAAADHIAKWNGTTWSAVGNGLGDAASAVYAMAVDGNRVFAGGSFQNAGGDPAADEIAVYDGSPAHWHSLHHDTTGSPIDGPVFAMAIIGRTLYVGGGFDNADGLAAGDAIAAYNIDSGTWSAMLPQNGELSTVSSMVPDGAGGLFVGGGFLNAGGVDQADFVAEWTGGTSWASLGADQAGTNGALKDRVRGLSRSGSNLYVVGDFVDADGLPAADNIARWDGSHWSAMGNSVFSAGTSLRGVLAVGGSVFVVGYFKNAGGNARADSVAAFVGNHWTNVGSNPAGTDGPVGLNSTLSTVAAIGSHLYVGGLEQAIGGSTMNAFGAWYRMRQPDALIGSQGGGVYNGTGANQTVQKPIARGASNTFSLRFTNDGLVTDSFYVFGEGSAPGFTATYLDGTTNITAQIVSGGYQLTNVPPGGAKSLTLKVAVANSVAVGATHSWLIGQQSTVGNGFTDAVKAVAKATN
jgi:hypothetical protein